MSTNIISNNPIQHQTSYSILELILRSKINSLTLLYYKKRAITLKKLPVTKTKEVKHAIKMCLELLNDEKKAKPELKELCLDIADCWLQQAENGFLISFEKGIKEGIVTLPEAEACKEYTANMRKVSKEYVTKLEHLKADIFQ